MLSLLLCSGCTDAFFYPDKHLIRTPADVGLKYEDVWFKSGDGTRLHGWFLPAATRESKGTILFLHGNAENISTHLAAVYWLPAAGFNLFTPDYRGYGLSEGDTSIEGVHADALAAVRYLQQRPDIDQRRLVLFGQSLGGAIAIYTAAQFPPDTFRALIVEGAFGDYREIAQEKLAGSPLTWPLQWPGRVLVNNDYNPIDQIDKLDALPKLFIYGDADQIVPIHHGRELFDAAGGSKEFWPVKGGRHMGTLTAFGDHYRPALVNWLEVQLDGGH